MCAKSIKDFSNYVEEPGVGAPCGRPDRTEGRVRVGEVRRDFVGVSAGDTGLKTVDDPSHESEGLLHARDGIVGKDFILEIHAPRITHIR